MKLLIFSALSIISIEVSAGVLLMKDGRNLRGSVVTIKSESIIFASNIGGTFTFKKSDVLKYVPEDPTDLQLKKIREEEETRLKKELAQEKEKNEKLARQLEEIKKGQKTKWGIVGRSAILPGWGHYYSDMKKTGFAYSFLFFASLSFAGYSYSHYNHDRNNYESSNFSALRYYIIFQNISPSSPILYWIDGRNNTNANHNYNISAHRLNLSLGIVGVVYFGQLIHAYFTGRSIEKAQEAASKSVSGIQDNTGLYINIKRENQNSGYAYQLGYNFTF